MSSYRNIATRISVAALSVMLVCTVAYIPILPHSTPVAHAQAAGIASALACGGSAAGATVASNAAAPAGTVVGAATGALPVYVTNNTSIITSTAVTACNAATQTAFHQIFDPIAWAVAKAAIQSITKSMVNWINSGFNGSPAFVTDLNRTMLNLSDGVANSFFNSLQKNTGVNVRSPFQDQVTQLLRNTYYGSTAKMSPNAGYNLNRYSDNPQAFLNGNFSSGGFDAWFAALSNDQNNPLGAFHAQQNELESQIASFRENQLHELDWGRGFLSWRGDCLAQKSAADSNADILSGQSLSAANDCVSYEVKTPGSVVENALGITVTSPLRQLELANSVNEIVGALATQLVNQVLGGTGLSGLSSPSSGGGSSYLSQATDPSQYAQPSVSGGFVAQVAADQTNANTFLAGWQKILAVAQGCTSNDPSVASARTKAAANITRANSVISALGKIASEATAALTSTDSTAALAAVSTEYQNLISNGLLISTQEAQEASQESNSNADSSLYSSLTKLGCSAH